MLEPTPGRIYHDQSVPVATDGPCGIGIDDAVLCLFLLLAAGGFLLFVAHNVCLCTALHDISMSMLMAMLMAMSMSVSE